jgi:amidase
VPRTADHPVVARLRAAGAVVIGITRAPELCLYAATDGPGAVSRNPWDTARSPAGSSGGSAAAVASGSVPLAHGNDGMGSLRLPAAACGLVTLKPGRGVVPAEIGFDDWSGMAVNGALATTVADVALAHAVLAGEEPAPPVAPGRPLRIAVTTRSPVPGVRADGPAGAAVDGVVALLTAAGHTVIRRDPPITMGAAAGALVRWMAGAEDDAAHLGVERSALQPRSRTHARMGRTVRRAGMLRPRTAERFRERMIAWFSDVDLLLSPVTTGPPLPARPWHERSFLANVTANARWAPWTAAWNLAGLPALVLPAGTRPGGLPLAVQFVGPPGAEGRLLWLAGELERQQPWRRYAPVFDPTTPDAMAPV